MTPYAIRPGHSLPSETTEGTGRGTARYAAWDTPKNALGSAPEVSRSPEATEEGSALVWLVICLPMLFAFLGLIFDGGAAIAGSQEADNVADQAARAGADQVDLNSARADQTRFGAADISAATTAACQYVTAAAPGASCSVSVTGDAVTVAVEDVVTTQFIAIVGIQQLHVHGNGSADSHTGIDEEIQ